MPGSVSGALAHRAECQRAAQRVAVVRRHARVVHVDQVDVVEGDRAVRGQVGFGSVFRDRAGGVGRFPVDGRRLVGARNGDSDQLIDRAAVAVADRDLIGLRQRLTVSQELNVSIVDREGPRDLACAVGILGNGWRESTEIAVGRRRRRDSVGVSQVDVGKRNRPGCAGGLCMLTNGAVSGLRRDHRRVFRAAERNGNLLRQVMSIIVGQIDVVSDRERLVRSEEVERTVGNAELEPGRARTGELEMTALRQNILLRRCQIAARPRKAGRAGVDAAERERPGGDVGPRIVGLAGKFAR